MSPTPRIPITPDERARARQHLIEALALIEGRSLDSQPLGWIEDQIAHAYELLLTGIPKPLRSRSRPRDSRRYWISDCGGCGCANLDLILTPTPVQS